MWLPEDSGMTTNTQPLLLFRRDPARNMARFYGLSVEPSLFAEHALVRRWGRIGTIGQSLTEFYSSESEAVLRLEALSAQKRRRGYRAE